MTNSNADIAILRAAYDAAHAAALDATIDANAALDALAVASAAYLAAIVAIPWRPAYVVAYDNYSAALDRLDQRIPEEGE